MATQDTAEYILEKVAPVFNRQGYVGASMSDLTKATNLTKGAIYGHFTNKEELAFKAFRWSVRQLFGPMQKDINAARSALAKLKVITAYYAGYYAVAERNGGCPVLNVSVDARFNNPKLFNEARSFSRMLVNGMEQIIYDGIMEGEIKDDVVAGNVAKNIYSIIQGGVFMAATHGDESYLLEAVRHVEEVVITHIQQ